MAGFGVLDTTPAPEIMYKYAQGAQKGLKATKKNYTIWVHTFGKRESDFM